MPNILEALVELYIKAATFLPLDVESSLGYAYKREKTISNARKSLSIILENIRMARETKRPICQDTGVPIFFVKKPLNMSQLKLKEYIIKATRIATEKIPLRPNAVDILTEKNSGDNTGIGFPIIYFEEVKGNRLIIDLMLKGAGCENIGKLYSLPAKELNAERDFSGVRKCVIDTIYAAQGRGCPPYIIGVGIGASRDQVTKLSKEQLLRKLGDKNEYIILDKLEKKLIKDVNNLGIGPLGFGGKTTALGVKIGINHRHPASYFVDVSISCWADRRAKLIWEIRDSRYKIQN